MEHLTQNRGTGNQAEVSDLLAQGYEPKEIAIRLDVSLKTIKTHIRTKLRVSTKSK